MLVPGRDVGSSFQLSAFSDQIRRLLFSKSNELLRMQLTACNRGFNSMKKKNTILKIMGFEPSLSRIHIDSVTTCASFNLDFYSNGQKLPCDL